MVSISGNLGYYTAIRRRGCCMMVLDEYWQPWYDTVPCSTVQCWIMESQAVDQQSGRVEPPKLGWGSCPATREREKWLGSFWLLPGCSRSAGPLA